MFRVHFLGTNGWYDTETGNTTCILVDTDDYGIVLDAGNGIHKLPAVTSLKKPFYLFLSHLHLDHICGLHILNALHFTEGLQIFVPTGQSEQLRRFVSPPYTVSYQELSYRVSIEEYSEQMGPLPFELRTFSMKHSVPTVGFRLRINEKVIAYCPDTGYCDEVLKAGEGADLFITECAYLPGESSETWPHLNPETAARAALRAKAKKLVLVHFDASRYTSMEMRKKACEVASAIFKDTCYAIDGMVSEMQ